MLDNILQPKYLLYCSWKKSSSPSLSPARSSSNTCHSLVSHVICWLRTRHIIGIFVLYSGPTSGQPESRDGQLWTCLTRESEEGRLKIVDVSDPTAYGNQNAHLVHHNFFAFTAPPRSRGDALSAAVTTMLAALQHLTVLLQTRENAAGCD
jgi:hypothetical protein